MRWASSLLFLVLLFAACDLPTTSGSGGSSATTSTSGTCAASNPNNCDDCQTCADNGPCASDLAACNDDPNCQDVMSCAEGCGGDATCLETNCYAANPDGQAGYEALASCRYCQQCTCSGLCSE